MAPLRQGFAAQAKKMKLKKLWRYSKILVKRVYRPVKPIVSPLLKKIKIVYLLIVLLIIGIIGNYQYWLEKKEYQKSLTQKSAIEQEIFSREKILETKPEYRDVLLKLALLSYQIYDTQKTNEFWQKANYLDPNNPEVQKIGEIISSQP